MKIRGRIKGKTVTIFLIWANLICATVSLIWYLFWDNSDGVIVMLFNLFMAGLLTWQLFTYGV